MLLVEAMFSIILQTMWFVIKSSFWHQEKEIYIYLLALFNNKLYSYANASY